VSTALIAAVVGLAIAAEPGPGAASAGGFAREEANHLGMNVGAPLDWEGTRLYADAMKTARTFQRPTGAPADLGADGWPREDFEVVVWHGISGMQGTYALSFRGRAQVQGGYGAHEISETHYDAARNTTTARVRYLATNAAGFLLKFSRTRRSATAPAGSGITDVKLMRPVAPGAPRSLPPDVLFYPPSEKLLDRFQVLRFMDFLATNNSQLSAWADRPLPRWASFNRMADQRGFGWQGIGGPLEHVILLANRLRRDAWITIPAKATDDYVRKVALLFRYGSDGAEPYLAPQARPAFPPLASDLKLYVEYSNEVWNGAGAFQVQFRHNHDQALIEAARAGSPLAFDGTRDEWALAWRRVANRTVQISNAFREVYGDAQMMTRIRPVLMTQQGDGQGTLTQAVRLLLGYYDNAEGEFVATPRPPGYYVYGVGGSGYYGPDAAVPSTLDGFWTSRTMALEPWRAVLRTDVDRAAALGVRRVCYEGGPSLDRGGPSEAVAAGAVRDPRMRSALVAHHRAWSEAGGELFVYFTAVGDHQWGFTPDVHELDTPKLQAIGDLLAERRAAVTYGTQPPATLDGNRFSFGARGWDAPGPGPRPLGAGRDALRWVSYTFREAGSARRHVTLQVRARGRARVGVYWDGALLGVKVLAAGSATLSMGDLDAGPGLHGLVVSAVEGDVVVEAVRLD
jgi:hypothetical protein